jgi:hypothetical protein
MQDQDKVTVVAKSPAGILLPAWSLILNRFRLAARRYWDELKRGLKPIYTAVNAEAARALSTSSPRSRSGAPKPRGGQMKAARSLTAAAETASNLLIGGSRADPPDSLGGRG